MLLKVVTDRKIAELRCVAVPAYGMAARPVAGRHGADVERHADGVTGIEPCASDLGELPCWPQIACSHFGISLEAAGCEHHAFCLYVDSAPFVLYAHAMHAVVVGDERDGARVVCDCNPALLRDFCVRFNEARAAAPGLNRKAAPELEFPVDFIGLPSVDWNKPDTLALHPPHRVLAACYQQFA